MYDDCFSKIYFRNILEKMMPYFKAIIIIYDITDESTF
jgi:GTPase SAR1 family protein